jgi:gliding motility-associated-like protein
MGHGSEWTDGGEGFAVKFEPPLEAGEYYEFPITYVSDGMYSDSSFDPAIYTNSIASLENADSLGRLPPAGTEWLKTDFGFVADSSQDGHEWLIIHTGTIVSSGLISSFCPDCIPCEDYDFHLGSDTIVCVEDNFRLTIDSIPDNSSVLWNTGSTNPFLEIIETDRYFVEVITEECAADDTLYVEVISKPNFDLGIDRELCPGDKIELSAHSIYSEYIWNTGTSDSLDIITEPGWYSATAINQCGIYSDSVRFVCEKIIMPNVFSPNADGINDNFAPLVYEDINDANLRIFNRWGKEVFNTDRIENGWNGNINGKTASTGAYYWHLSYINIYGDVVQINGQFQLKE